MLEEADFIRRGSHKSLHRVLVRQEIGAFHGVPGVQLEAVTFLGAHHRGGASFCAHGMRAHDLHFRHDTDVGAAPRFDAELDRGAQPGESGSQDQDIMSYLLHASCAPSSFQPPPGNKSGTTRTPTRNVFRTCKPPQYWRNLEVAPLWHPPASMSRDTKSGAFDEANAAFLTARLGVIVFRHFIDYLRVMIP